MTKEIIGYRGDNSAIYKPEAGKIYTQAFIICSICGKNICHVGGPSVGAKCLDCKPISKRIGKNDIGILRN